jgi:hypothetical protein
VGSANDVRTMFFAPKENVQEFGGAIRRRFDEPERV